MKHKLHKLENGVRLITVPIENMESATITVWIDVGSRFESSNVSGLSHFLEHMVFKGSTKRPSAKLISEAIDSFGGEFNASTSKEWTNFYIKARSAKILTAFDVLSDMVLNPILDSKEMEKEKGVIIEEIGMYEDTPMMHIGDVFERLIFKGDSLGRDIIGTRESVRGLKRSHFVNYRETHYGAQNIVITVSGGINENEIIKLTQKYFSTLKSKNRDDYKRFELDNKGSRVLLDSAKKEQAHFILGFLGEKRGNKDRFTEAVLSTIMGGGMSSRLFSEVREKRGLAYSVRSSVTSYADTGYHEMYAGVDPKRVDEAIKVSLDQYYGLADQKYNISAKELKKAKEYLKGHMALSLEDTKSINHFFGLRELKLGKIETPEEVFERIDEVSISDVVYIAKKFYIPERLNFAIIGPYEDSRRFEKLIS